MEQSDVDAIRRAWLRQAKEVRVHLKDVLASLPSVDAWALGTLATGETMLIVLSGRRLCLVYEIPPSGDLKIMYVPAETMSATVIDVVEQPRAHTVGRTRTWTFDLADVGAVELRTEARSGADDIPTVWEEDEIHCRRLALAGQGAE